MPEGKPGKLWPHHVQKALLTGLVNHVLNKEAFVGRHYSERQNSEPLHVFVNPPKERAALDHNPSAIFLCNGHLY
jgi:hypothetical protein